MPIDLTTADSARRLFEDPNPLPARRERYRAHHWRAYSPKLDRAVHLYRTLGYEHWVYIEANPSVTWFTERPIPIRLRVGSNDLTHRFDMVLERAGAIECHQICDAHPASRLAARLHHVDGWCRSHGYHFQVITPGSLEQHRLLVENWSTMLPYIKRPSSALCDRVLLYIASLGEVSLQQLLNLMADIDRTKAKGAIFGLLHRGILIAPSLSVSLLSPQTLIRRAYE